MRRGAVAALAVASLLAAVAAFAATSPWVTKANATCRVWDKKATAALGSAQANTDAQTYVLLRKSLPLERGLLAALEAIKEKRPPGASRAFALARLDIAEVRAAIAAYRTSSFHRKTAVWASDRRADRAFVAIGARNCGSSR